MVRYIVFKYNDKGEKVYYFDEQAWTPLETYAVSFGNIQRAKAVAAYYNAFIEVDTRRG